MSRAGALLLGPSVEHALARPYNNFAILRLALALAVVVSHAASVTSGQVTDEPLTAATGFTLGEHAVNGFFAISGFLVTMSFVRRGWLDYVVARALRILPGLVAAVLAVSFLLGPAMSQLPPSGYLANSETWRFVTATLTTFKSNLALPGVFPDNPFRFPMGTVWTLKYEILCYLGVLGLGLVGLLRLRLLPLLAILGLFAATLALDLLHPDAGKGMQTAFRLPLIFGCGACLYLWHSQARLSPAILVGLVLATILARHGFAYKALLFVTEAYGAIWLGLAAPAHRALDLKHDLSYGTYLYGWPVQQSLHALLPGLSAEALLAPSLFLTLVVAGLSWSWIEKPALALKARYLGRRTLGTIEPAAP